MIPDITCVVLAGGTGERLWPVSREGYPKPFVKMADGETLIYKTYARAQALTSEVLTVTNRNYYFISRDEEEKVGSAGHFLLEPFARNTAPAIALAAKAIEATKSPEAIILVLPADHLIANQSAFAAAVRDAKTLAKAGYLVTVGINPTCPETGFGYIECGERLEPGYKATCFVEKPDLETAKVYVDSGKYLWNSGIFCFKAGVFLEELEKHSPEVAEATDRCWNGMQLLNGAKLTEIPAGLFELVPNISVDCAVMEKSQKVAIVASDFSWSDIGSWNAVRDLVQPDGLQNRAVGEAIFIDSQNTFTKSEGRLVAVVGVNNLMIIDTPDALLVAHPDKAQDVRQVVAQLKKNNHDAFKVHRTVSRPWGGYTVLKEEPGFKIKRIEVKPGASLSLQMHRHRSEHWVVVSGAAKITNGDKTILILANESAYIPAGQKHRLENAGVTPCVMIEVQCGSYLGEDDIVRFEDTYGRTG